MSQSTSSDAKEIIFATGALRVNVNKGTGSIRFLDSDSRSLLAESEEPEARQIHRTLPGPGQATQIFLPHSGEKFYGLGQHQSGVWNYSGESLELTQDNTNISIPFFFSNMGYGLLWNFGGASRFNNRFAQRLYLSSFDNDQIDYFFIAGPDADEVIRGYRHLTGQAPLFGQWAYGLWQSKNRYTSQSELLEAASRYRAQHIPIDNIVLDWFWWTKMGSHQFTDKFPDPKAMVDALHTDHLHVMLSVWPFFQPGTPNFEDFEKHHGFIYSIPKSSSWMPGASLYDAFDPGQRARYWKQIRENLYAKGFDAWWQDVTEPETLNQEANTMQTASTAVGKGSRVANLFPLMTTKAIYDGLRAENDDRRVFLLTRSGSAGMQRNAAAAWSGDIFSTWESFRRQIPAGLNYSISGLPYWTTDIGGFVSGNPDDSSYRELFIRWFEYGAFCPIFRVHGTREGNRNELWSYGTEAQRILTAYDRLRYRLLPYIYATAWQVTSKSSTVMRPLVMDFRSDENAASIGDQFLFGPSIMVSPVTHAGERTRRVYLPAGTGWTDFWTGTHHLGGSFEDMPAPLDTLPLSIRDGSILALGPDKQYAAERPADPIELRIYPGADGQFVLYEDEGDSYRYEQGVYATIPIRWDQRLQTLTIGQRQGAFPGMLNSRKFRLVWVHARHGIGREPEPHPDKVITYDGHLLRIRR